MDYEISTEDLDALSAIEAFEDAYGSIEADDEEEDES